MFSILHTLPVIVIESAHRRPGSSGCAAIEQNRDSFVLLNLKQSRRKRTDAGAGQRDWACCLFSSTDRVGWFGANSLGKCFETAALSRAAMENYGFHACVLLFDTNTVVHEQTEMKEAGHPLLTWSFRPFSENSW